MRGVAAQEGRGARASGGTCSISYRLAFTSFRTGILSIACTKRFSNLGFGRSATEATFDTYSRCFRSSAV